MSTPRFRLRRATRVPQRAIATLATLALAAGVVAQEAASPGGGYVGTQPGSGAAAALSSGDALQGLAIAAVISALAIGAAVAIGRKMHGTRNEAFAAMGIAAVLSIVATWTCYAFLNRGTWEALHAWLLPAIAAQLAAHGIATALLDRLGWLTGGTQVPPPGAPATRAPPTVPTAKTAPPAAPRSAAAAAPDAMLHAETRIERVVPPARDEAPARRAAAAVAAAEPRPAGPAPRAPAQAPAPAARTAPMPRVFISYRRSDSSDVTGRLHDRLSASLGRDRVFTDVDSIPLGVDFREHVSSILAHTDCMLAVIGRDWVEAADAAGRRRLDDPADLVRIEIETALARRVPVIPLLVQGAAMPTEAELPPSLRGLAFRNGMAVRPNPDFHRDVDRLEHQLIALAAKGRAPAP